VFLYGQKPIRSDFFRKANLPVNMDVFSGKLAFWPKKKGQKWPHGNTNISTTTYRLEV
jgi:hypothetical protein